MVAAEFVPFPASTLNGPPDEVAPSLLGAVLSSNVGGRLVRIRITEVEAYGGADDPASHAFRGKTGRNAVMFGPAGFLYIYFVYGMHWCANVVCGESGEAGAVLIRAGEVIDGVEAARGRRPAARADHELAMGPARLASCLGLDRQHDGTNLCSRGSPVQLSNEDLLDPEHQVRSGPRVGIRVAVERPWRFWLANERTVSRYRPAAPREHGVHRAN
jgi:DNA-3-methyladenine glycosylase